MLTQLRQLTKGWVAGIFVFLIAIAFAIWGMPNMFNAAGRPMAKVNGQAVEARAIERAFNLLLQQSQPGQPPIPRDQAIEAGLHRRAIDSLIFQEAVFGYAKRLGMTASDGQVAEEIRGFEAFQDAYALAGGGFDPVAYRRTITEAGYGVAEFEETQRALLATQQLVEALSAGARAPQSFGLARLAFDSERRALMVAEIPPERFGTIEDPTEEALAAFYEERGAAWREPERRTLAVAVASVFNFMAGVDLSEERLRSEYNQRAAQWAQPELRSFVQLVFQNQAAAEAAAARLAQGADPDALGAELGAQVIRQDDVSQNAAPDRRIAEAVFALPDGAPPQAMPGALAAWSAVQLLSVTPATQRSFEDVRGEIADALTRLEATRLMQEAMSTFETQRRRRTPFSEAASAAGLQLVRAEEIAANGRSRAGEPALDLPNTRPLLQAAFEARQGRATDWVRLSEGVEAVAHVEGVIAPTEPPLADVREPVQQAWREVELDRRMTALGQELVDAVAAGQPLAEVARARNLRTEAAPAPLSRQEIVQALGQVLAQGAITAAEGTASLGYNIVQTEQGMRPRSRSLYVVQVTAINRADPAESGEQIEAFRREETAQLRNGLSAVAGESMRFAARVEMNEAAIAQTFQAAAAETNAP